MDVSCGFDHVRIYVETEKWLLEKPIFTLMQQTGINAFQECAH